MLIDDHTVLLTPREMHAHSPSSSSSLAELPSCDLKRAIVTSGDVITPVLPHVFAPRSTTTLFYFNLFRLIFKARHVAKKDL